MRGAMAAKYGKKASEKVARTMHEFKRGKLKSGSGGKVTSRKQALAIGLSQARRAGYKMPPAPRVHASMSLDARVRGYLDNMKPGTEIDAGGIARALGGVDPLEADYALERAQRAGLATTRDGRWFGPVNRVRGHATKKGGRHATRKTPAQLDQEIKEALSTHGQSTAVSRGEMPCECGSYEAYWHGDPYGLRRFMCDVCWEKDPNYREDEEAHATRRRRSGGNTAHARRKARAPRVAPYRITLTPAEIQAANFARGRYAWPDMLLAHVADDGSIAFTESEMWNWTDDVDSDASGGHSPFPLASGALAEKLQNFYDSRV